MLNSLIDWATADANNLVTLFLCFIVAAAAAYTVSR